MSRDTLPPKNPKPRIMEFQVQFITFLPAHLVVKSTGTESPKTPASFFRQLGFRGVFVGLRFQRPQRPYAKLTLRVQGPKS